MTSPTSNSNPNNHSLLKPDFRREFRLGLVLYGGIALAIYMNGVCREFYNAMRGRGIYKLIKALTDSDIIIDIVSGASAGGINGVLLSYALANSDEKEVVEFEQFAQVWRNSGDIDKLLHQPSKGNPNNVKSLLNGEKYYQEEFEKAFRNAGNYLRSAPKNDENEWYSDFRELDLFITGTDVSGKIYRIFDKTGNVIEIKDHRTVFHLKHRQDRQQWIGDPFLRNDETTYQALAKLCRITSCFPVAFPVVRVKLEPSPADPDCKADKKLVEWGHLKNRILPPRESTNHEYPLYFIDGGVLENRPFRHTIQAIDRRTAYDDVDRKLFYLDPNPDFFVDSPDFKKMEEPSIWRIVKDSLINLPSYQSIGRDIENIDEFNQKIKRYRAIRQDIDENCDSLGTQRKVKFPFIFLLRFNKEQHKIALLTLLIYQNSEGLSSYLRCRFLGLFNRLVPIMFNIGKYQGQDEANETLQFLEKIAQQLSTELENQKNLEGIAQQIKYLDLQFAYRKHCFLISTIARIIKIPENKLDDDNIKELRYLKYRLTWQLELIKIIQESLDGILSELNLEKIKLNLEKIKEILRKSNSEVKLDDLYEFLIIFHQCLLDQKLQLSSSLTQSDLLKKYCQQIESISKEKFTSLESSDYEEIFKAIYELPICKFYTDNRREIIQEISEKLPDKIDETDNSNSILNTIYDFSGEIIKESVNTIVTKNKDISEDIKQKLENLKELNKHFDKLVDYRLYPYEYVTNLEGKTPIELLRISPLDAKLGFGKGLGLDDKLAGHQLRAFGGFFKKSWRSNDILWGRLDGLNCLLKALITKESIKRFQDVVQRESKNQKIKTQEYIERLVEQSIGFSTKKSITRDLIKLFDLLQESNNGKELDDLLNELLEQLVEEGQKKIISTDLEQVIEDAIDQQIQWSDIQEKEDWLTTVKNIVQSFINIRKTIPQAQEVGLTQEINQVINSLDKLKAFRDKDLQTGILEVKNLLEKLEQTIKKNLTSENSGQNDSQENQLQSLKQINYYFDNFNQESKNNTLKKFKNQCDEQLKQLFRQALNLDDQDTQKIIVLIRLGKDISNEKWYEFLARILKAIEKELKERSYQKTVHNQSLSDETEKEIERQLIELNQKIEPVLDHVFNSIKPKYNPIIGTLDPDLTMWTARALAKESLTELKSDDDKADYFKNLYRVSQEELGKDVPSSVHFHLLIKSLLVFQDILVSWRGKKIYKNPLFSLFNFLLSRYESEKSKNRRKLLNWFFLIPVGLFIFCIWQLWLAKPTILVITIVVTTILLLWLLIYLLHSQFDQILKKILK